MRITQLNIIDRRRKRNIDNRDFSYCYTPTARYARMSSPLSLLPEQPPPSWFDALTAEGGLAKPERGLLISIESNNIELRNDVVDGLYSLAKTNWHIRGRTQGRWLKCRNGLLEDKETEEGLSHSETATLGSSLSLTTEDFEKEWEGENVDDATEDVAFNRYTPPPAGQWPNANSVGGVEFRRREEKSLEEGEIPEDDGPPSYEMSGASNKNVARCPVEDLLGPRNEAGCSPAPDEEPEMSPSPLPNEEKLDEPVSSTSAKFHRRLKQLEFIRKKRRERELAKQEKQERQHETWPLVPTGFVKGKAARLVETLVDARVRKTIIEDSAPFTFRARPSFNANANLLLEGTRLWMAVGKVAQALELGINIIGDSWTPCHHRIERTEGIGDVSPSLAFGIYDGLPRPDIAIVIRKGCGGEGEGCAHSNYEISSFNKGSSHCEGWLKQRNTPSWGATPIKYRQWQWESYIAKSYEEMLYIVKTLFQDRVFMRRTNARKE